MSEIRIKMIGTLTIFYHDEYIENKLSTKAKALIACLLLSATKKIKREILCDYLWPDSDEDSSKYNLRFCLWSIKRIIRPDTTNEEFIICERDFCYINNKYDIFCDVVYLRETKLNGALTIGELCSLKSIFEGELLEGFYVNNASDFNDLILLERECFHDEKIDLLKRIYEANEVENRMQESIATLKEIHALDPYNEEYVYALMEKYQQCGNSNSAIIYYQNFAKTLRKDLNVSPIKKLSVLYETLIAEKQDGGDAAFEEKNTDCQGSIIIDTFCLKEIPFFWVSDTIDKIVEQINNQGAINLDISYIRDLASIQQKMLLLTHERIQVPDFVSPIRIVNAFFELMKMLSINREIIIKIYNHENMDISSADALRYIESNHLSTVAFTKLS